MVTEVTEFDQISEGVIFFLKPSPQTLIELYASKLEEVGDSKLTDDPIEELVEDDSKVTKTNEIENRLTQETTESSS